MFKYSLFVTVDFGYSVWLYTVTIAVTFISFEAMDVKYELTTSDKRYYDPALHRNYSKEIEDVIHVDLSSATFCYPRFANQQDPRMGFIGLPTAHF